MKNTPRSRERAARRAVGTPEEEAAFEELRSVIVSEARRINGLMYCARLRCGIMPTRFEFLVKLLGVSGTPRQPEDIEAEDYLGWLLDEAARLRPRFLKSLEEAVAEFNRATTAAALQLDVPFDLWRKRKRAGKVTIGDVVEVVDQPRGTVSRYIGSNRNCRYAVVLNESDDQYMVGISGEMDPRWMDRSLVQACRGAAVLLPGPPKQRARAEHKIETDYKTEPDPPAASLSMLI